MDKKYGKISLIVVVLLATVLISGCIDTGATANKITFDGHTFEAINGFSGGPSQGGKNALLSDGATDLDVLSENTHGPISTDSISDKETRENKEVNGTKYIYTSFPEESNNSTTIQVYFTKNDIDYNIIAFVDSAQFNDPNYMKTLNETIERIIVTMNKT